MSERAVRWALFLAVSGTVPVLFYALVIGGIAPLLLVFWIFLGFLFSTVQTGEYGVIPEILAAEIAVYAPIFYFVARAIAKRVCRLPTEYRSRRVKLIVGGLLLFGLLPIYSWGPDNLFWGTLYGTYFSVLMNIP